MVSATDLDFFIKHNRLKIKEEDQEGIEEILNNMPKMQIFFERMGNIADLEFETEYWRGDEDCFRDLRQLSLYPNKSLYGVFYDEMLKLGGTPNIFKKIMWGADVNEKNEYIRFDKIGEGNNLQYVLKIYLNPKKD